MCVDFYKIAGKTNDNDSYKYVGVNQTIHLMII